MSKNTPPVPDYASLAQQQGAANKETAIAQSYLNHPNEITPYGTRTWTTDPNDPLHQTVTSTLSPAEQQKLDAQNSLMQQLLGGAGAYAMPALMEALQANYQPPRDAQLGWESVYAPDQRLQTESGMWEAPYIQEGLDFSSAPGIPTADNAMRQQMENAIYGQGARYLDTQYQQRHAGLDTKLSNQGIFSGSEAFKTAQQDLSDQEARDYGDLRDRSIMNSGDEMARMFGMGLQAHQAGVGDITTQGQFANSARSQLISELLSDMQARNAAIIGQGNIATGQQQGSNSGTQAWLAQKAQSSTLPINVVTALMSGGQVNNPQWQPYANNISWEPAPVYQAGRDQYQGNLANYNAQQGAMGQWLNFGSRLGGAAIGKWG